MRPLTLGTLSKYYSRLRQYVHCCDSLCLRADEACRVIRLLKQDTDGYYNKDRQILEHYRHKSIFLRRSNKAYIGILDDDILTLAKQSFDSYQAIRSYFKRRKMPLQMRYCRKIFGTWLRQHGVAMIVIVCASLQIM